MSFYDMDMHNFEVSAETLRQAAFSLGGKCPGDAVEKVIEGLVWAVNDWEHNEGHNHLVYLCLQLAYDAMRDERGDMDYDGVLLTNEMARECFDR